MLNTRCNGYLSDCFHKKPNAASNPVSQHGLPSFSLRHCSKNCSQFLPQFCFRQSESSVLESDTSSKAASFPCQDHRVHKGSDKLQSGGAGSWHPRLSHQSTSAPCKWLYRKLLLARATDTKQGWRQLSLLGYIHLWTVTKKKVKVTLSIRFFQA